MGSATDLLIVRVVYAQTAAAKHPHATTVFRMAMRPITIVGEHAHPVPMAVSARSQGTVKVVSAMKAYAPYRVAMMQSLMVLRRIEIVVAPPVRHAHPVGSASVPQIVTAVFVQTACVKRRSVMMAYPMVLKRI
jgi:hypothetical protein